MTITNPLRELAPAALPVATPAPSAPLEPAVNAPRLTEMSSLSNTILSPSGTKVSASKKARTNKQRSSLTREAAERLRARRAARRMRRIEELRSVLPEPIASNENLDEIDVVNSAVAYIDHLQRKVIEQFRRVGCPPHLAGSAALLPPFFSQHLHTLASSVRREDDHERQDRDENQH